MQLRFHAFWLSALAIAAAPRAKGIEAGVQLRARLLDGVYDIDGSIDLDKSVPAAIAWA